MSTSRIEWTEVTWNPVTGCTNISPGCKHCYAERMAGRLKAMGQPKYRRGFKVTLHEDCLELPLRWQNPRVVFVNSMSDLFHESVPEEFIRRVFDVMKRAEKHTFQVLTKRADRLEALGQQLDWPDNVWIGVSVENSEYVWRIDCLRKVPAQIRFLSLEPLIGPLPELVLDGINWVIVGGESGPSARTMEPQWCRDIRDDCTRQGVPFFFKQWGGVNKKSTGRTLDGRTWNEMPAAQAM